MTWWCEVLKIALIQSQCWCLETTIVKTVEIVKILETFHIVEIVEMLEIVEILEIYRIVEIVEILSFGVSFSPWKLSLPEMQYVLKWFICTNGHIHIVSIMCTLSTRTERQRTTSVPNSNSKVGWNNIINSCSDALDRTYFSLNRLLGRFGL